MFIHHGNLVFETTDGRYFVMPLSLIFFLLAVFVVGTIVAIVVEYASKPAPVQYTYYTPPLPPEIQTPQPVDHYAEQAARARALKEKLDADTDLAESYLKSMRIKGELEEVPEILDHERAKRIAQGR